MLFSIPSEADDNCIWHICTPSEHIDDCQLILVMRSIKHVAKLSGFHNKEYFVLSKLPSKAYLSIICESYSIKLKIFRQNIPPKGKKRINVDVGMVF